MGLGPVASLQTVQLFHSFLVQEVQTLYRDVMLETLK